MARTRRSRGERRTDHDGAHRDFDVQLRYAADVLRWNRDAAIYKHVGLGASFLKDILDPIEEQLGRLEAERDLGADPEGPVDSEPFQQKMRRFVTQLGNQQAETARIDTAIGKDLKKLGYEY